MVKSDLTSGLMSGGHIRPGSDMAGYENLAGFRPGPGPDMIYGATLLVDDGVAEHEGRSDGVQTLRTIGREGCRRWSSCSL